jgi:endonuclease G, mitochondrial
VQVSVQRKITDRRQVAARGFRLLPRTLRAPDGRLVPVDVVERSYHLSHELEVAPAVTATGEAAWSPELRRRRRLARPLPGVSISHPDTPSGTLGAIVYDRQLGQPCLLSNAHVLLGPAGRVGDVTVQPGSTDSADFANNGAGRVLRSHVGLAGDCAIARLEGRLFQEEILELGLRIGRVAKVAKGDRVVKSGRTTGVTFGRVRNVGAVVRFNYGGSIGVRDVGGFEIEIDPARPPPQGRLCGGGDSGAVWLIADDSGGATDIAVGLHFAEQRDPVTGAISAVACGFGSVLKVLEAGLRPPA